MLDWTLVLDSGPSREIHNFFALLHLVSWSPLTHALLVLHNIMRLLIPHMIPWLFLPESYYTHIENYISSLPFLLRVSPQEFLWYTWDCEFSLLNDWLLWLLFFFYNPPLPHFLWIEASDLPGCWFLMVVLWRPELLMTIMNPKRQKFSYWRKYL